ncbi:hypothetical protein [Helicobacter sp. 'CLO3_human']|uniref:hypothetical protein n=1 Tax=Helicobacter sp. 'CLO3_human' TaxID=2020249 RepID=UPI0012E73F4E|nr:hypothetical protein [Helicobacter sp. 'CLO3_human']
MGRFTRPKNRGVKIGYENSARGGVWWLLDSGGFGIYGILALDSGFCEFLDSGKIWVY